MQRVVFITLLLFLAKSLAYAQLTGGEIDRSKEPDNKTKTKSSTDEYNFNTRFTLGLPSIMTLARSFGGATTIVKARSFFNNQRVDDIVSLGTRTPEFREFSEIAYLEIYANNNSLLGTHWDLIGSDFYLNRLKFAENARLGISVNWWGMSLAAVGKDFTHNIVYYNGNGGFQPNYTDCILVHFLGVGPNFLIYPFPKIKSLGFQLSYQLVPTLVFSEEVNFTIKNDISLKVMAGKRLFSFLRLSMGSARWGDSYFQDPYSQFPEIETREVEVIRGGRSEVYNTTYSGGYYSYPTPKRGLTTFTLGLGFRF